VWEEGLNERFQGGQADKITGLDINKLVSLTACVTLGELVNLSVFPLGLKMLHRIKVGVTYQQLLVERKKKTEQTNKKPMKLESGEWGKPERW
jgi:hypothetical protein